MAVEITRLMADDLRLIKRLGACLEVAHPNNHLCAIK